MPPELIVIFVALLAVLACDQRENGDPGFAIGVALMALVMLAAFHFAITGLP